MASSSPKIIITDTSVLINYLNVDKIELLRKLRDVFLITEHVINEVSQHYQSQYKRLQSAIKNQLLNIINVDQPEELELFTKLVSEKRLGTGECSAIACAINRNYPLAIDDVQARKQAIKLAPNLQILTTQDILVELVVRKIITIDDAEEIKNELHHKYRFAMKIDLFKELVL